MVKGDRDPYERQNEWKIRKINCPSEKSFLKLVYLSYFAFSAISERGDFQTKKVLKTRAQKT